MYRSLGGIAPAAPGYERVTIAPRVSPTQDPSSVNASVTTVRGVVTSNWTRHAAVAGRAIEEPAGGGCTALLSLSTAVPAGAVGEIHVPMLGCPSAALVLDEVRTGALHRLWQRGVAHAEGHQPAWLLEAPKQRDTTLRLTVAPGEYDFVARCGACNASNTLRPGPAESAADGRATRS